MIIIAIILLILGGFSKSVMDRLADNKWNFIVRPTNWFDFKSNTWSNKYKNNDPRQGEKFLLSTTVLVFLTDAWHFFQMLAYTCLIMGVILMTKGLWDSTKSDIFNQLLVLAVSKGIFTIAFQLFYKKPKIMKKIKTLWKILFFIVMYNIIAAIPYWFEIESLMNIPKILWWAEIIISGLVAIIGFIYGLTQIKK